MKTSQDLTIVKIFNNSSCVVQLDHRQFLLIQKGIAFGKKINSSIKQGTNVEQLYELSDPNHFISLFEHHSDDITSLIIQTLETVSNDFQIQVDKNFLIPFADHVAIMYDRVLNHRGISNPFLNETIALYPESYSLALEIGRRLFEKNNIELPKEELGFLALHLQNFHQSQNDIQVVQMNVLVIDIQNILVHKYHYELHEDSLNYARFLTHIKFLVTRILHNETIHTEAAEKIAPQFSQEMDIAFDLAKIIETHINCSVSNGEIALLALHISRFSKNKQFI